jgi:hypothetical protein
VKPVLASLAVLALAVGAASAEPPTKDGQAPPKSARPAADETSTPSEILAALKKQVEQSTADRNRDLETAKTRDAEQKVWQEHRKRRDAAVVRAVEMARKNPRDPAALEALQWVTTGGIGWGSPTDVAFDVLMKDHLTSDKLERVCLIAALYNASESADRFLHAVLDKSPHRALRGVACLSLGRRLYYAAATARYEKRPDADRLQKESEQYYERVVAEFADVQSNNRPIGERASAALFEMRYLVPGKPAPDIAGEDVDGKKFKLSDFRGKVVVLDFWGHW